MVDFDFRAAIARRPGGATQAELIAAYGVGSIHPTVETVGFLEAPL